MLNRGSGTSRPSTFSIVAVDPDALEVGLAVQSKFPAVGSLMQFPVAGVGAVVSQSFAEVTFGPRGLDLLASGVDPEVALDQLLAADEARESRQVGIVDASGRSASFTGADCFEHAASVTGSGYACQGNVLASKEVVTSMAQSFQESAGALPERLIGVLRAGLIAGGDRRGQQSAALLVAKPGGGYGGTHDRYIDLRVDDHPGPVEELARLLDMHRFYFERPDESEVIEVGPDLGREIADRLTRVGWLDPGHDLWDRLSDYMGWENLEERWAEGGRIDPKVLAYLRAHAESGSPPDPMTLL